MMAEISKDVVQRNTTSEEDAINKSHQLELIYTQSGYIYNIPPNALRLQTYQELPGISNSGDKLIGSMTQGYLGSNSQNLGYTHSSTQSVSQPRFQSHHMPQKKLTNRAQAYHQGGPYPLDKGTQYTERNTDGIHPPNG